MCAEALEKGVESDSHVWPLDIALTFPCLRSAVISCNSEPHCGRMCSLIMVSTGPTVDGLSSISLALLVVQFSDPSLLLELLFVALVG